MKVEVAGGSSAPNVPYQEEVAGASSVASFTSKPVSEEALRIALTAVRKIHSTWDRLEREANLILADSKVNENTRGDKIEGLLESRLEEGKKFDQLILQQEAQFAKGAKKVGEEAITFSAETVTQFDAIIKDIRKKQAALKNLFEL